jgi:hypothetical protein
MTDAPASEPEDLEDMEDIDEAVEDVDEDVRALIEALREEFDSSLRLAVRYTADEHDVLFVREDVDDQFTAAELDERVATLVMKGLGDPPEEGSLYDFGTLDATVRWYDEVMVTHFPYRDWSGLLFTFDRQDAPVVDLANEYLAD